MFPVAPQASCFCSWILTQYFYNQMPYLYIHCCPKAQQHYFTILCVLSNVCPFVLFRQAWKVQKVHFQYFPYLKLDKTHIKCLKNLSNHFNFFDFHWFSLTFHWFHIFSLIFLSFHWFSFVFHWFSLIFGSYLQVLQCELHFRRQILGGFWRTDGQKLLKIIKKWGF